MAVLSTATASGKQFAAASMPTGTANVFYTAPNNNANVTAPSATAYIKEIILCNTAGTAATVTLNAAGATIMGNVTIAANDTKILSGLTTMMPASSVISGGASVAGQITLVVSGVEVQ